MSRIILAVARDPEVRRVLRVILGEEGFDVRTAATGSDALAILRATGELPRTILLQDPADGAFLSAALHDDMRRAPIPIVRFATDEGGLGTAFTHPSAFAALVSFLHQWAP